MRRRLATFTGSLVAYVVSYLLYRLLRVFNIGDLSGLLFCERRITETCANHPGSKRRTAVYASHNVELLADPSPRPAVHQSDQLPETCKPYVD